MQLMTFPFQQCWDFGDCKIPNHCDLIWMSAFPPKLILTPRACFTATIQGVASAPSPRRLRASEALKVSDPAPCKNRKPLKHRPGTASPSARRCKPPTSAQAHEARWPRRGRHRKCLTAPRMQLGGGGCQGDGSFKEPLVLAIGDLERVSTCGPRRLGSSSPGSQDVLLPEQESEFSRGLPLSSSFPASCGRWPNPACEARRPDSGFAVPPQPSCLVQHRTSCILARVPDSPWRSQQPSRTTLSPSCPWLGPFAAPAGQTTACFPLSNTCWWARWLKFFGPSRVAEREKNTNKRVAYVSCVEREFGLMVWIYISVSPSSLLKIHQATPPLGSSVVTALVLCALSSLPNGRGPAQFSGTVSIFITIHTSVRLTAFRFGGIFFSLHLL